MQRELNVAAALHVQRADDVDARCAQHLIFEIGKRLRGRDDDRVAGVHADRIDVLHVADDDAVVGLVAEDFVLDLFPAEQRRLDQRLMDDDWRRGRMSSVARSSASSRTRPPPVPPSVYAGRTTSG